MSRSACSSPAVHPHGRRTRVAFPPAGRCPRRGRRSCGPHGCSLFITTIRELSSGVGNGERSAGPGGFTGEIVLLGTLSSADDRNCSFLDSPDPPGALPSNFHGPRSGGRRTVRAAGRGGEPRPFWSPATQLDRSTRRAAVDPAAGGTCGGIVRSAVVAHRGHARVQRHRRTGSVPRSHSRLPGAMATTAGRCRRRHGLDPRSQRARISTLRTGGRRGSARFTSTSGRPCSRLRSRDMCWRGCDWRIANRRGRNQRRRPRRLRRWLRRGRLRSRRGDSSPSPPVSSCFQPSRRSISRVPASRRWRVSSPARRRQRSASPASAHAAGNAVDVTGRLPRDAGMHFDSARPRLSGGRLCSA